MSDSTSESSQGEPEHPSPWPNNQPTDSAVESAANGLTALSVERPRSADVSLSVDSVKKEPATEPQRKQSPDLHTNLLTPPPQPSRSPSPHARLTPRGGSTESRFLPENMEGVAQFITKLYDLVCDEKTSKLVCFSPFFLPPHHEVDFSFFLHGSFFSVCVAYR